MGRALVGLLLGFPVGCFTSSRGDRRRHRQNAASGTGVHERRLLLLPDISLPVGAAPLIERGEPLSLSLTFLALATIRQDPESERKESSVLPTVPDQRPSRLY